MKFYRLVLDSLLVILMYSLWILDLWFARYDVCKLSVTMCVTLCCVHFLNFVSMLIECHLPWIFAWDSIWMLGLTMIFCGFHWSIFHLIGIFVCCLVIFRFFLSDQLTWLVKFSYLIIWSWNFVDWFLTCLISFWLLCGSFILCHFCFALA